MKRSTVPLATLLGVLVLAASQSVMPAAHAASWAAPAEPGLVPVATTPCPAKPAPGEATCLAQTAPVSDRTAAAAGAEEAGITGAAVPGADTVRPQTVAPQTVRNKTGSYTPADLASLYRIPAGLAPTATIGIVDVGSDPNTEAQLSYYRSYFGLPACTRADGCFREVAQDGSAALPATNSGWVVETALDVQAITAICPTCHILLVDAATASISDMARATQTATQLGAAYVSLSYGSSESTATASLRSTYYNNPDVTYVAAAGDSGYSGSALFPASAPNVVAAGGTSAKLVDGVWQQTAWSGSGSGCSAQSLISTVQTTLSLGSVCGGKRAVSDLSALADPATGMLFYRAGSWWNAGGTSLAAPILTGLYALAGNHTAPLSVYRNTSALVDVTSGSTGSCGQAQLCAAGSGWDGPTGLGTPAGLGALGGASATGMTGGSLDGAAGYPAKMSYHLVDALTGVPIPAADVTLERQLPGHGFTPIDAGSTNVNGDLNFTDEPTTAASYRVVFAGDVIRDGSTSNTVSITSFLPKVTVSRQSGRRLHAVVRTPWGAALRQTLVQVQQRHGRSWKAVRKAHTDRHGIAEVRLPHRGTYRLQYGGGRWRVGTTKAIRVG